MFSTSVDAQQVNNIFFFAEFLLGKLALLCEVEFLVVSRRMMPSLSLSMP